MSYRHRQAIGNFMNLRRGMPRDHDHRRAACTGRCLVLSAYGLKSDIALSGKCHVWTAPDWQELFLRFAALVGAAMCSAF
jgi:hypothetical protein